MDSEQLHVQCKRKFFILFKVRALVRKACIFADLLGVIYGLDWKKDEPAQNARYVTPTSLVLRLIAKC